MLPVFKQLQEIFMEPKTDDKTNDKAGYKTDYLEQPDSTDMPDLESEESAEQKRNQEGKRA